MNTGNETYLENCTWNPKAFFWKYENSSLISNVFVFIKFLGISILGLCLELFSYTVMMSYNYTNSYDFLSYMEYPILLLQEYALIYFAFKYQNLLGLRTQVVAVLYVIIATLIYLKLFPLVILQFLVVSTRKTTFFK